MRYFFCQWLVRTIVAPAIFAASAGVAQAQTFALQPAPSTGFNGQPYGIAVADVNGDSQPDALVANTYTSTLAVLLGNGTGGFTAYPISPSTGAGTTPYCVAVADVNGDNKPDVLTANYGTSTLSVLLGDGLGGFTLQAAAPSTGGGSQPMALVLADVNSDGQLDALTANSGAGTLGVLLGNGAGGFALAPNAPATGTGGDWPRSLAVTDVNNDGKLDVLAANSFTNTVGVLLGNGLGGFTLASTQATGIFPTSPYGIAASDVNNDGKPDALTANFSTSTVSVLLGNGLGGFTLQANSPVSSSYFGGQPAGLALADINGDGNLDALTINSNYGNNTVGVLLGDGRGGFVVQANSPSAGAYGTPFYLAVADVNSDGRPDILAPSVAYGTLGILLNTTTYLIPTLVGISPSVVAVGAILALTGTGLAAVTQVHFTGATQTAIISQTATRLEVRVPAGARPGPVTVSSPGGTSNAQLLATVLATQASAASSPQARLYPNPAEATQPAVQLAVSGLPATTTSLSASLLDALGRTIYQCTIRAEAGTGQAALPTAGLAKGLYVLRLNALDSQGQVLGTLPTRQLSLR